MTPRPAAGSERHEYLRTSCGRELTVGRLALGDVSHPAARVFVDLGSCPGCSGPAIGWAGLTVAEARELAAVILAQATAAEHDCHRPS